MRLRYYAELLPGKLYLLYCHIEDYFLDKKKRKEIIAELSKVSSLDAEQETCFVQIKKEKELYIFHGKWARKYDYYLSPYGYDKKLDLPYIIYPTENGKKRIYLKRGKRKKLCQTYGQSILKEQDEQSPHRYMNKGITEHIDRMQNSVVIDLGVAEGNFAAEIVDKVGKVFLFEADNSWNESLKATFSDQIEKIEIVNNYVSDHTDIKEGCISLDEYFSANVMPKNVSVIKMDIEGAELSALCGMKKVLETNPQAILLICLYHTQEAEKEITEFLSENNYEYKIRPGYMTPLSLGKQVVPYMRRGVLEAKKRSNNGS